MARKPRLPPPSQLRGRAEREMAHSRPAEGEARSAEELLQELQVHQIELEMQNEALRRTQLALEESRDRYVDLYEFAPVGYLTLTNSGLIAGINLTGAAMLGEDRRKLQHRRFMNVVAPEDKGLWERHFVQALRQVGPRTCELRLKCHDGTVFDANLDCLAMIAAGTSPTLRVTLTDISARKRAALAMHAAQREAESANAAKSNFLAAASHDLRQPLQALRLFIDMLVEQLDESRHKKLALNASAALTAGENLLHALLDVSKFDAGMVVARRGSVAFADIAADLFTQCDSRARQKGLKLTVVGSSAVVDSDPVLLSRMLRNLLDNAIKYTRRGRILLGCRRIGDQVRIEVWDTGLGIAADQQELIFDDFYQVGNLGRDQSKGLGIGLAVVSRTARLLGHQIAVRSWPGRGSVFSITVGRAHSSSPVQVEIDRPARPADDLSGDQGGQMP